uniref:Dolichyl-diphosphooligosaccharide--protein glycosyltransferase subunit 1 n=3 Tax=Rhodosorus marinus TaxID=101924 RepID=A0A7S3E5Y7_9RHOD
MPLPSALKRHNGVYMVKVSAQPTVSDPLQVDKAFFRVMLPEGAYDVKLVETEPSVKALEVEKYYPTLSYLGKKQFSVERSDFVADPASPATIYIFYRFSSIHLLVPIAVLALILFAILVLVLVVRHSDLKIDRNSDKEDDELALYKEIQKLLEVEKSFGKLGDTYNQNVINYGNKDETVKFKQDQNRVIGAMKDLLKDLEYVYSEIVKLDAGEKRNGETVSALHKALIDRYAKLGNVASQLIEGKLTQKEAEADARKINDEIDICSERIIVAQSSLTSQL